MWSEISKEVRPEKPQLWSLLELYDQSSLEPSIQFRDLIRDIALKSKTLVDLLCEARSKSPALPTIEPGSALETLWDLPSVSGSNYKSYQMYHTRPWYDHPSEKKGHKTKEELEDIIAEGGDSGDCRKLYNQQRDMSNGICTFLCAEHHQLIGYHILKNPESVNDAFSLLTMMYPGNTAPKAICCDNACALHKYAMSREPIKYRYTRFLNDQWHQRGHKCGSYYDSKGCKLCVGDTQFTKDTEIETINGKLEKSRPSTGYMNLQNFNRHVEHVLELHNRESINKISLHSSLFTLHHGCAMENTATSSRQHLIKHMIIDMNGSHTKLAMVR